MTQERWVPSVDEPRGGESPLNDFWGVLKEWVSEDRSFEAREGMRATTVRDIHFHFIDLEVIDAEEPYPHPVADIMVRYADPSVSRGNTRWAHFSNSVRKLFGKDPKALDKIVSKRQHWVRTPGNLRVQEDGEWIEKSFQLWTVAEVEGLDTPNSSNGSGPSARELALDLANGKTEQGFYEAALSNASIMRDAVLVGALTDRSFIRTMIDAGILGIDTSTGVLSKLS